jgi:hypothetical protein
MNAFSGTPSLSWSMYSSPQGMASEWSRDRLLAYQGGAAAGPEIERDPGHGAKFKLVRSAVPRG